MASRDLRVTLLGEDRTGSAFGSAGKQADGLGAKFASVGRGIGLALGGAAVAGIAGIGVALFQGARDAASYQQITDQLAQTLKSTGGAAGASVEQLKTYAGQLESISGVDEELILSSQNVLATFTRIKNGVGEGNDVFNQASQAALNLSTTMGGDLQGASVLVGKALNDPIKGVTALGRAGVQLTQAQKDTIKEMVAAGNAAGAQKIILGELETQFGGAAAAAGQGLTGSLARAKDAFSDIFREVATRLLPTLADAADWAAAKLPAAFATTEQFIKSNLVPVFKSIAQFWDANGPQIVSTIKATADGVIESFRAVGEKVVATVNFFREHDTAAKVLAGVVTAVAATVAAAWVAQAAVSTVNAAKSVLAWMTTATASTTSATIQSKSTAQIVVGWVAAAAGAVASVAKQVAAWVLLGAQSMLQAAKVAAAWLIAMGPIALVIAAVVGAVVLIVKNWDTIKQKTAAAWQAVAKFVTDGVGKVVEIIKSLPGKILAALGKLGGLLLGAGGDIVSGLAQGIRNGVGNIKDALLSLLPGPLQRFAGALGISSPSTVFAGYGKNIGEGLALGVRGQERSVAKAVSDLADVAGMRVGGTRFINDRLSATASAPTSGSAETASAAMLALLEEILDQLIRMPREYQLGARSGYGASSAVL